ncbi:MAG TPA: hypothetical protein VLB27_09365, partial [candidate division Zixibacteria bacterium]|nr:hypothetical protein [candidate division Zixibacteria bacterium]
MTRRRPLSQVIGALLLLTVLLPPAARGEEPAVSLGVQGETGWWGREESGPGVGLAQRPVSEWRFTLTPRLSLWGYELSSRILLTSLNDALAEAQNRLQLELKGERFGVAVGDNFTADHPLVARGARIRGVSGYARPNEHYSVSLFYGRTRRANEGDYDSTAARVSRFGNYERRVLNINATVEVR